MADDELVEFHVYDNNGDMFSTYITRKEARETDGNAARTLRLLQRMKACGQKPSLKWDETLDSNDITRNVGDEWLPGQQAASRKSKPAALVKKGQKDPPRRRKLDFPKPPSPTMQDGPLPPRATGKSGAQWGTQKTDIFLDSCLPYSEQLRCKTVPLEFWQHISDVLFALDPINLNYSPEQLREKMRLLKGYNNQKKEGKHGKSVWEHQTKMDIIFGSTLEESTFCEPSMSHGIEDLFAIDYKGRSNISGKSAESELGAVSLPMTKLHTYEDLIFLTVAENTSSIPSKAGLGNIEKDLSNTTLPGDQAYEEVHPGPSAIENDISLLCFNSDLSYTTLPGDQASEGIDSGPSSNENFGNDSVQSKLCAVSLGMSKLHTIEEPLIHRAPIASNNATMPSISGLENFENYLGDTTLSGDQAKKGVDRGPSTIENVDDELGTALLIEENLVSGASGFFFSPVKNARRVSPGSSNYLKDINGNVRKDFSSAAQDTLVQMNSTYSHFNHSRMKSSTPSSSPAKKKSTSGPVYSPRKANKSTPKRKIGAIHLVWDPEVTDKFMNVCLSKKDSLKKETIPPDVWKAICDELHQIGIDKEWQMLRAKFENMDKFFRKLLDTNGMANGMLWPYYARFCEIYNIDEGFEILDDVCEEQGTPRRTKQLWKPERERLLLTLYTERKPQFDGSKCPLRHSILYNEIATQMNLYDVPVNAKQCKSHMSTLLNAFRTEYDESSGTGQAPPKFHLYDEMLQVFKGCPTLEPPVSVTIGRGVTVTQKKDTKTAKASKSKAGLQKAGNQYCTLPTAQTSDSVADEVRRMADIYEHESNRKYVLFERMVQTIEGLKPSDK